MEILVIRRVVCGVALAAAAGGMCLLGPVGSAAGAEPCGESESIQEPCTQGDGTVNLPGNGASGPAAQGQEDGTVNLPGNGASGPAAQGQEDGTVNLPGNGVSGYTPRSVPAGSAGLAAPTQSSTELLEIAVAGGGVVLLAIGGVGWHRRRQEQL